MCGWSQAVEASIGINSRESWLAKREALKDGGAALWRQGGAGYGRRLGHWARLRTTVRRTRGVGHRLGRRDRRRRGDGAPDRSGRRPTFIRTDVSDAKEVEALISGTMEIFGRLDCAVNNAGIEGALAPTADYPEETWNRVLGINLTG